MAVPEQTPYSEHTGNGVTTSFSLGFICESKDHLIVLVDEIEPPIATWSLTGGNVVFTTAPASGSKITLQRNTPFGRTADYHSFNNSFRPQSVNGDFDRLWLKLQELVVADWLMKLYVDRLHQQQEVKINDLKSYVDDRDDELRSYLVEEIRKQGVALDQLDEYYNYLMQRLAQIAVDKGWDASFVVDASGQNQQSLNNGLESIAQLRATNPPSKGFRVYVKSYHPDLNQGGGYFVSTQKNGLVDNGVTVFASQNPLIFWVRSGVREVTPFMAGAKGDNANEDAPAFVAALSVGLPVKAEKPPVAYKLSDPITLPAFSSLIGEGERVQVRIAHTGWAFTLNGNSTLSNFEPKPFGTSFNYAYDSVRVLSSHTNRVRNVKPFFPKVGFKLEGPSYWNRFSDIDVFLFKEYGIHVTAPANNNFFDFEEIASNAPNLGGGVWDYDTITWEQAAIKCESNFNTFIGGEPAPSKYGVIVGDNAIGNRFIGLYMEKHKIPLKTGKNSETYFDSPIVDGFVDIHPDSTVSGPSGKTYARHMNLCTAPLAGGKGLKGLWYFNEGAGNKVYDHSGNNKHLTVTNPIWNDNGRWGKTIQFDRQTTTKVDDVPLDIADWEQPFAIIACIKIPDSTQSQMFFSLYGTGGRYLSLEAHVGYWAAVSWDGTTINTTSGGYSRRSSQDGYVWVSLYVDPVNKTISSYDPSYGAQENIITPNAPNFSFWNDGGVVRANIGRRGTVGLDGNISFFGIWQRRLTLSEVTDLVNMKVPNIIPSGTPIRLPTQTDTVATDVATLASDFNALLAKMRAAGLML